MRLKLLINYLDLKSDFRLSVSLSAITSLLTSVYTLALSGCSGNTQNIVQIPSTNIASTTQTLVTLPSGDRSAKIIFKQSTLGSSTSGSFDTPPTSGTIPGVNKGHKATRLFKLDGSLLGSGTVVNGTFSPASGWPAWIKYVEIGISGSSNTSAANRSCARFSDINEATQPNCKLGSQPSALSYCGAPAGQFRVSEVDCSLSLPNESVAAASTGTGGPNDGVYIRVIFNRDTSTLGASENILAILEYAASALNPAPLNPSTCFQNGNFTPERCSDFVWRVYLKQAATDVVQPFLLLVPPTFSAVLGTAGTIPNSGTGIATRQILLPLASNSQYSVLQVSRVQSNFPNPSQLEEHCKESSPLCAGMVIYSLSLIRM